MLLLNDRQISYFTFPGGEIQVQLPDEIKEERVRLTWKPVNSQHILLLMLTVNALQEAGINDIDLDVVYLPYARQDRICTPGQAFSLKVICNLLNQLNVSTIRLWDVHNNDVTSALLNCSYVWHWEARDIFERYKLLDNFDLSNLVLCAPDKGAKQRVDRVVSQFDLQDPLHLMKKRNPDDGKITTIYLKDIMRDIEGYDILIVDDICDGGATFLQAAEVIKANGAENLYLYVTHGIFSKGIDELSKHFSHIYCHHVLDEMQFSGDARITILKRFLNVSQSVVCY